MAHFRFSDVLTLADYLQSGSTLEKLDISGNVQANSKGLLIMLRACQYNQRLKVLKANDSSIVGEVIQSVKHLVEQQRNASKSRLRELWILNSGVLTPDSNKYRALLESLCRDVQDGDQPFRKLEWSLDTCGVTPTGTAE